MKYNIGDTVKIRADLDVRKADPNNNILQIPGAMLNYTGKIARIKAYSTKGNFYCLDIDDGHWCWTDDMLEEFKIIEPKKFKMIEGKAYRVTWLIHPGDFRLFLVVNINEKWMVIDHEEIQEHLIPAGENIYPDTKMAKEIVDYIKSGN